MRARASRTFVTSRCSSGAVAMSGFMLTVKRSSERPARAAPLRTAGNMTSAMYAGVHTG